ncbi:hypothetical protein [Caloranaerobacter azorensis]|uniref:Uncharacterized protein n=3 Tax=Caloranaerobacter azorensis TaxID=116090 RepID=A0A1M5SK12_9FIRM|nr:hypothetical protein [Caloranaerobacter azorensis]KGG80989.1 hypothetical protein Y919_03195 [Caloranaerobacter azorensis H53214]QIB27697.1 hypothetical protein G3A45_10600 [Caloranaerobacter azorensis]SHH38937.1 hypothetical protein SAMN02745135_00640 [Caloranaerobacter azorensis DSM 13643]
MLIDCNIAIAIRCDICGEITIHNISLFDFSRSKKIILECDCGQSKAIIKTKDYKNFWIELFCFACQDIHVFKYSLRRLLKGKIIIRCIETGIEISFIGKNYDIKQLVKENEKDFEEILSELGFYDYFQNFEIMMKIIDRIREMDSRGKIFCDCGSDSIRTDLYPDRIELKCAECGSTHLIYAETEEDLKKILECDEIQMHKYFLQCIDIKFGNNDSDRKS